MYAGLPLYVALRAAGHEVFLANLVESSQQAADEVTTGVHAAQFAFLTKVRERAYALTATAPIASYRPTAPVGNFNTEVFV